MRKGNRKNNSEPDWSQTQILFDIDPLKYRVIGALKYQIKQSIQTVLFGMTDVIRVK